MDLFQALLLGVVEGITEFLPISSTGHLILISDVLRIEQTEFHKTFEIVIQFGAILSVVALYWREFLNIEIVKKVLVAFLPTAVVGFLLYPYVKSYLIGNSEVVLWALLLGGIGLIVFEYWHEEKEDALESMASIPYAKAVYIGLFQAIALVPGVSRSAATILGGLLLGLKRTTIVEFSFLLAVPTMLAASALDLFESAAVISSSEFGVLAVGFVVSFIVAGLSIKFLLAYVRKHSFVPFGAYRIILAGLFFALIIL